MNRAKRVMLIAAAAVLAAAVCICAGVFSARTAKQRAHDAYFSRPADFSHASGELEDIEIYVGGSPEMFGHDCIDGHVYTFDQNTGELSHFYNEEPTATAKFGGEILLAIEEEGIKSVDFDGNARLIIKEERTVTRIDASKFLIFYRTGDTLCRYHIESGITDSVQLQDAMGFAILTNNDIKWWRQEGYKTEYAEQLGEVVTEKNIVYYHTDMWKGTCEVVPFDWNPYDPYRLLMSWRGKIPGSIFDELWKAYGQDPY